jgi:glutathione synthase
MGKQIFFINELDQLVIKKDSTLLWALSAQERGHEAYLLFEQDLYYQNSSVLKFDLYEFKGTINPSTFYIDHFEVLDKKPLSIESSDVIHMRIDPPFDTRYTRYLWILGALESAGVTVKNKPSAILNNNEKLTAFCEESSLKSCITSKVSQFEQFCEELKYDGHDNIIIKPLDLYQGMGVEKLHLHDLSSSKKSFKELVAVSKGPIITQPFYEQINAGEIRAGYFKGKELGSILKVPKEGEFLANIAQGASFDTVELSAHQKGLCEKISKELHLQGADLVAFDLLGDYVSEVNITCPGLLVETSKAHGKNLCLDLI